MKKLILNFSLMLLLFCLFGKKAIAHSFPDSKAEIFVQQNKLLIQFKTPVDIFNLATKMQINILNKESVDSIKQYFSQHVSAYDDLKSTWNIHVDKIFIQKSDYLTFGKYDELVAEIYLTPSNIESLKRFYFNCDAIVHQVVNQSTFLFIQQDLNNGILGDNPREVGIIKVDNVTNKILPVKIEINKGSWWKGFKSMLALGMQHIKEGTDHLLFIIVLLLPAMLLINGKQWGKFGGTKYSVKKLLKIVTAFTIGHSITLLIGALGWVKLPTQPVEILIAVSILVSAIHAIYPIFPGKETYVAAGFGLIHGLAFATILSNLKLNTGTLVLSIVGFNIGIEIMQLFVIALIVPWLILIAKTNMYKYVRVIGAVLAAIAALAWIVERSTGIPNFIATTVPNLAINAKWGIVGLAIFATFVYVFQSKNKKIIS